MQQHNFANYKSGAFATDITNLELAKIFLSQKIFLLLFMSIVIIYKILLQYHLFLVFIFG